MDCVPLQKLIFIGLGLGLLSPLLIPCALATQTPSAIDRKVLCETNSLRYSLHDLKQRVQDAFAGNYEFKDSSLVTIHGDQRFIDGIPTRFIQPDGEGSKGGESNLNDGIYFFVRNGEKHVLKTFFIYPGLDPALFVEGFSREIAGAKAGELFDAAKVIRWGILKLPDGSHQYFQEMTESIPGTDAKSLKPLRLGEVPEVKRRLEGKTPEGTPVLQAMANKLLQTFDAGVEAYDLDFLIGKNGELEWLDTNLWVPLPPEPGERTVKMADTFYFLLQPLLKQSPSIGAQFVTDYIHAVHASTLSRESQLALIKESFPADEKTSRDTWDGIEAATSPLRSSGDFSPQSIALRIYNSIRSK